MAGSPVLGAVLTQIDYWWAALFWPRIQGLTDDEFDWEPEPGTWSLSRSAEGDRFYEWPPGSPGQGEALLTTVSWRLAHIGNGCLASRAKTFFDLGPGVDDRGSFPGTAREAVAFMREVWEAWRGGLGGLDDEALFRPLGPDSPGADGMGLGSEHPFLNMVMHNHRELLHHGAEINLLRDLWWSRIKNEPLVAACLAGDIATVERIAAEDPDLVEGTRRRFPALMVPASDNGATAVAAVARLGFDANPLHRRSPLHAAVARGDKECVAALVAAGADLGATDLQFNATPLEWAGFLNKHELVGFLQTASDES